MSGTSAGLWTFGSRRFRRVARVFWANHGFPFSFPFKNHPKRGSIRTLLNNNKKQHTHTPKKKKTDPHRPDDNLSLKPSGEGATNVRFAGMLIGLAGSVARAGLPNSVRTSWVPQILWASCLTRFFSSALSRPVALLT